MNHCKKHLVNYTGAVCPICKNPPFLSAKGKANKEKREKYAREKIATGTATEYIKKKYGF